MPAPPVDEGGARIGNVEGTIGSDGDVGRRWSARLTRFDLQTLYS